MPAPPHEPLEIGGKPAQDASCTPRQAHRASASWGSSAAGTGLCGRHEQRARWPVARAGDFSDTLVQGRLVHDMRYLASVVTQCFTAFGELLAMNKRLAQVPTHRHYRASLQPSALIHAD